MKLNADQLEVAATLLNELDKLMDLEGTHVAPNTTAWFTCYSHGEEFFVEVECAGDSSHMIRTFMGAGKLLGPKKS
jgi:hypothetical protein